MSDLKKASREMHYQTFLVSCWQEHDEVFDKTSLRFRVEIPKTGEHHLSTSLKDVMSIIETELCKTFDRN
jgi:hypothetical protein